MSTIAKTRLGTSDDASICKGFALFPAIGTARAGISVSDQTKNLLNVTPTILAWRFSCVAGYQIIAGVCGPAYGISFDIAGSTADNGTGSATFNLSNDNVQAGFFVGLSVRLFFTVSVQQLAFRWVYDGWDSRLESYWSTAFSRSIDFKYDIIALTLELVRTLLRGRGAALNRVADFTPALQGSWGMLDGNRGEFSSAGKTTVSPTLDFPINLVPLVPALRPIVEGLENLGGNLEAGPTIGLVIPVDVTLRDVSVTDQNGTTFKYRPRTPATPATNGVVSATGPAGAVVNPTTIGATIDHAPGFDLRVGVYFKVSVCKLFEFNGSTGFNLLERLGIVVQAGPYGNALSNTVGRATTGRSAILPSELSSAMENLTDTSKYRVPKVAFRPRPAEDTLSRSALAG